MRAHALIAPALAVILAVAGCSGGARPFGGERNGGRAETSPDLLKPPGASGITVLPVTGGPDGGRRLAKAVAAALRSENVTARVGSGSAQTRWLTGHAESAGNGALDLTWNLYGTDGERTGVHTQTVPRSPAAWSRLSDARLARIARAAAGEIAAMIQDRPPRRRQTLSGFPEDTRVVVRPVTGTPTAGARALGPALAGALRRKNLPLADQARRGDIVVTGKLTGKTLSGGARRIRVTWVVRRKGRDKRLGDLSQANVVPAAALERGWSSLAKRIARGAAPGVVRLLRTVAHRQQG